LLQIPHAQAIGIEYVDYDGTLDQCETSWDERAAVGVVLAAGGYPASYDKGLPISGLDNTDSATQKVFHAGTTLHNDQVVTSGGRVLCATGLGDNVTQAQQAAYALASKINWQDMFYRKDIAYRAIAREQ